MALATRRACSLVRPTLPAPRGWAVWTIPATTLWLVLTVTALAGGWTLWMLWAAPLRADDLLLFGVLLGAGAVSVEATRRVPEPAGMNANDMLSAWWLPITVLLPPVYALIAPAPLMALTQWRVRRLTPYRRVYSAAAIGVAHAAASTAFHALTGPLTAVNGSGDLVALTLAITAAGVLAMALNTALIGIAVKTSDPQTRWHEVFWVDARLEVTEVCAGVVVTLLAGLSPLLVLIGLPPVLLAQRGMLYAQLHAAARVDAKTGLLNAVTWEREAAAELAIARRRADAASVLLIDIDHFKRVNDMHGHLVGDAVIRGVADVLRAHSREGKDLVGRFGGEEFAVFLPGVDATKAPEAAERLRRGVAELVTPAEGALVAVTVSVGVAVADPVGAPGTSVPELLAAADRGMYRAKAEGRDQVRLLDRPERRAARP